MVEGRRRDVHTVSHLSLDSSSIEVHCLGRKEPPKGAGAWDHVAFEEPSKIPSVKLPNSTSALVTFPALRYVYKQAEICEKEQATLAG